VFGRQADRPFDSSSVDRAALAAWKQAGITPITLHEARHTFASLRSPRACSPRSSRTRWAPGSITMTYDRYGHLMPDGRQEEAARQVDAYLAANKGSALRAVG
jgi:integrase